MEIRVFWKIREIWDGKGKRGITKIRELGFHLKITVEGWESLLIHRSCIEKKRQDEKWEKGRTMAWGRRSP